MIETVLLSVAAIGGVMGQHTEPLMQPRIVVAEAAVAETPTPTPTPEPVVTPETVEEEPEVMETQEAPTEDFYSEPQEDLPPPADSYEEAGQTYIGTYAITWYAREEFGYDAPGASGLGCTPGYTCAVPESWMLGHTILINGYGYRLATDISPDGIVDIYVASLSEIPSYGVDYQDVYIVD